MEDYAVNSPPPAAGKHEQHTDKRNLLVIVMLGLAVALSAAALAVALLHAGPRGAPGPVGQQGPAGQEGPAGPAGQGAPVLNYTCQQLFPRNGPNGTETTMYWPCTDNANG